MRIVYDDKKQGQAVNLVKNFFQKLGEREIPKKYDYGMDRIDMAKIKEELNDYLDQYSFERGNTVVHDHGIGNNCRYPIYFKDEIEHQICAYINLNTGMYGEGYCSMEDFNGVKIMKPLKISKWGISLIE